MSDPYVGEIRMFGGNFAPAGWMLCQGQLLPISEYETLFNLIGTTYGGDGQQSFQLPDLQGRAPRHQGTLGTTFIIGQSGGVETVTLTGNQLPSHSHPVAVASASQGRALATPSASAVLADENLPQPRLRRRAPIFPTTAPIKPALRRTRSGRRAATSPTTTCSRSSR